MCKEARTRSWILQVAHGCKPLDWSTRAKHARSWSVASTVHYRTKVPGWIGCLLVAWTCDLTQSRGQAVRTPCLAKYDVSHSFSPYDIYIPLYPRFKESFQREFWERNPREKQNWFIHNLHIETFQIPLLSSSPLLNPWEAYYQNLFSPYPLLWKGCLVLWEAVRKEPILHWLMLWLSSGI